MAISSTTFKKGHKPLIGAGFKKGHKGFVSAETYKRMGERMTGKNHRMFGKHHSKKSKEKIKKGLTGKKQSKETIQKRVAQIKGVNHWNWKGGISSENTKIRLSLEMILFRKSCMIRDNFTDQKTGKKGGKLVVHHINNFADFPELRFAIDNGITLSEKSHKEFHKKYGRKNNTRSQIEDFLS